jgi:hypothetical protein
MHWEKKFCTNCIKKRGGKIMRKKVLSVLVALVFVLGISGLALADTGAFNDFNAQYPATTISGCNVCHPPSGPPTNPYGDDLLANGGSGANIPAATFVAVQGLDSDGDGATNIQEINQGFLPGDPTSTPPATGVTITITSPAGGASIASGSTTTITYTTSAPVDHVKVKYSLDNGLTWANAAGAPGAAVNTFDWNVPAPTKNKTKVLVKVIGFNASNAKVAADTSSAFTIETVTITAPTLNQPVPQGGSFTITWLTNNTSATVDSFQLLYSTNNGTTYKPIFTAPAGTGNPGTYTWNPVAAVPKPKPNSLIKLILKDAAGNKVGTAVSAKFTIQ